MNDLMGMEICRSEKDLPSKVDSNISETQVGRKLMAGAGLSGDSKENMLLT